MSVAEGMRQEDVPKPTDGVEAGLEVNIISLPTEPNVIPLETKLLLSLLTEPTADAAGHPQYNAK